MIRRLLTMLTFGIAFGCAWPASVALTFTSAPVVDPKPLNGKQAVRLANALYRNYTAGGAHFAAGVPARRGGVRVLQGAISWKLHVASAVYEGLAGTSEKPRRIVWSPSLVVESGVPGLAPAARKARRAGVHFVARPLDPQSSGFDSVLALVNGFAATRPENPLLLQQGKARYLGKELIGGVVCERYSFGKLTFWLDSVGDARRIAAQVLAYPQLVVFDFPDHHLATIGVPRKFDVVPLTAVPQLKGKLARDLR